MLRIGMVGAENSHTAAIAKVLNIDEKIRGVRATHVWGETAAFAKAAAEKGQIPTIVRKPEEMMGEVDAIVVDHRHQRIKGADRREVPRAERRGRASEGRFGRDGLDEHMPRLQPHHRNEHEHQGNWPSVPKRNARGKHQGNCPSDPERNTRGEHYRPFTTIMMKILIIFFIGAGVAFIVFLFSSYSPSAGPCKGISFLIHHHIFY
ncbi:MAG TPA: hypothetical protein EYQ31_07495 [Candidatus Handelsmanbacteria bacterium]|nr:hypothetical protein [Candidatus Handelsmanbacteria bacterium]